jgi:hypothetical protein
MMLGAMLLLSMLAIGQTSKTFTEEMRSSTEIAGAAFQTYTNFFRARQAGDREVLQGEGDEIEIPSKYWADQIKALKVLKVYIHRVNIVVVQRIQDGVEEGKYIYMPISSYLPMNGVDGFEYTPNGVQDGVHSVLDYKRIKDGLIALTPQDLCSKLNRRVQKYSLSANNWLEALTYVAADFKIPMGIAWVDLPETKIKINRSWENTTPRKILDEIVSTQPGYEIGLRDGVLHVSAPTLIPDRQNFLKIKIPSFAVSQQPIELANNEFHRQITKIVVPSLQRRLGGGALTAVRGDEPKIDLDAENGDVEGILDAFILRSTRKIWIVTFSADTALTDTGYRKTKSLYSPEAVPENQPGWSLFYWSDALPSEINNYKRGLR